MKRTYEYTAFIDGSPENKVMMISDNEQCDVDEWMGKAAEACVKAWGNGVIIVDRARYDSPTEMWVWEGSFHVKFTNLNVCTECFIEELGEI